MRVRTEAEYRDGPCPAFMRAPHAHAPGGRHQEKTSSLSPRMPAHRDFPPPPLACNEEPSAPHAARWQPLKIPHVLAPFMKYRAQALISLRHKLPCRRIMPHGRRPASGGIPAHTAFYRRAAFTARFGTTAVRKKYPVSS